MTRLAFQLDQHDAAYRAAASRITAVEVVDDAPDALVTDDADAVTGEIPTLLIGGVADGAFPAFPWRFSPQAQAVRGSLALGGLGDPGLLRMHVWQADKIAPTDKIGAVDLALWLFGSPPEVVHAAPSNAACQLLHLGFLNGGMALIDFTGSLPAGEGYRSLTLIGSEGTAYADDHRDRNLLFAGGAPGATPPDTGTSYMTGLLENFAAKVMYKMGPEDAIDDYRRAALIVEEVCP